MFGPHAELSVPLAVLLKGGQGSLPTLLMPRAPRMLATGNTLVLVSRVGPQEKSSGARTSQDTLPHPARLSLGLTLDLINDPSEPPLYLPTLQPILPPDEDKVEKQQEEQRRGVHQLHPMAGGKRAGTSRERGSPAQPTPVPSAKRVSMGGGRLTAASQGTEDS